MRLLISTDLALRVLMRLSAARDEHVSTDVLARELAVSRNHLHKIVQYLTEAGLVRTIRGARGGVMLARPAGEIRIGEIVRGHEQDQALVECFRLDGGACTLLPRCRLRAHAGGREGRLLPASRPIHAGGLPRRTRLIRAQASKSEATSPLASIRGTAVIAVR